MYSRVSKYFDSSHKPVSYTHLDVYKRQLYYIFFNFSKWPLVTSIYPLTDSWCPQISVLVDLNYYFKQHTYEYDIFSTRKEKRWKSFCETDPLESVKDTRSTERYRMPWSDQTNKNADDFLRETARNAYYRWSVYSVEQRGTITRMKTIVTDLYG